MPGPLRPRLRPTIRRFAAGRHLMLADAARLVPGGVAVPPAAGPLFDLFDGTRTVVAIAAAAGLTVEAVAGVVRELDAALLLDGPAFAAYVAGPDRRPACVGVYPADPAAIPAALDALFTAPGGPGLPRRAPPPPPGRLRAVLAPHMDYGRGGVTYGWAFRDLVEQTPARLFVVVATGHSTRARFTLTRKHYATPLGTIPTDLGYVKLLLDHYGDFALMDRYVHLPEHSVELHLPFLQHFLSDRGGPPVRVVPLLVGSFHDTVTSRQPPGELSDVARMVNALRLAEAAVGEPVVYLISGDLAHIGPKFGDSRPLDARLLTASTSADGRLLDHLMAADSAGYFAAVAAEGDARRVCGLSPTWVVLTAARPKRGVVRHYHQYADPDGNESVSFAAASFYD